MANDITIPEDALSELFPDTDEAPEPADESEEPEEIEDSETDDEESGDEEPEDTDDEEDDELEDEETDESEEEESPDDDEEDLPKFDRKEIEKDPRLKAAYKHMQADYTKKLQAVAEVKRGAEQMVEQAKSVLDRHKTFLDTLADDKGAEDFLVTVAVNRSEVFQRAFDRASEIIGDPEKLERFSKEKDIERRERVLKETETKTQAETAQRQKQALVDTTETLATKAGLTAEADMKVAHRFVRARIQENLDLTGKASITREEIVEAVKEAAETLKVREERARKAVVKDVQKKAKKTMSSRMPKRPAAPKPSSRPAGRRGDLKLAPGQDPLDAAVDRFFETL